MRSPARGGAAPWAATGLALAVLLAGCTGDDSSDVRVAAVGRATVTEVVEAPAVVAARATASVGSPADGVVADLRVRDGAQVRRGQVLLRVESPAARRALRQALRADAQAASAGAGGTVPTLSGASAADATAQRAFDRARAAAQRIPDPQARAQALAALRVSQTQYDAARAQADQAAAQLASGIGSLSDAVVALSAAQRVQTRAAVEAARRTVAALTVRAPIAGTVSLGGGEGDSSSGADDLLSQLPESLQSQAGAALGGSTGGSTVTSTVAEGAPVSSGQQLVTVTDASTLSLTAQVDETDVLLVEPGVVATAELDAVPDATYDSTVTAIDPTPTTSTRGGVSYVVRLSLDRGTTASGEAAPVPRPGMSAVVDLRVRTARDVVAVPAPAVFRDGQRDVVWAVANGTARQRPVRLGAQGESRIEVLEGLEEGERIVVRGADRVREGQQVP
jgi:multidrug efflux pump subunit AcrA (membrane-fusion protein)